MLLVPSLKSRKCSLFLAVAVKKYVGRELITQGRFKLNNNNKFKFSIKIILNGVLDIKQNTYIIYCLP